MKKEKNRTKICAIDCKSKCCRSTPPSITSEDYARIQENTSKKNWYSIIKKNNQKYRIIAKNGNTENCIFLNKSRLCEIYEHRPLDCRLFPILFKIKRIRRNSFLVKWLIWYCPLTDAIASDILKKESKELIEDYLFTNPKILFEYQAVMYASGGYKRKHFLEEEHILISESE